MTPRSSDVSNVLKFFDGPGPDYLNKSKFSMRGYNSNQQTTYQNNISMPSENYGRFDTYGVQVTETSDFDSMPFPLRTSEQTTEQNYFNDHIRRLDTNRNYESSDGGASLLDQINN